VEDAATGMTHRFVSVAWIVVVVALACALLGGGVGCGGIGPSTIDHDRFDYTEAIATSWKQQMLANIVKLRYGDTPVFLDVASVINQYSLEAAMDLRLTWVQPHITVGDSQSTGASARYTDKPTITYTPLSGERFARSLMKPIPPTAVLSLIQAGYPIDGVLRVCVHSINGVRNRYGGSARARVADPEFYPLLQRMRRVQDAGGLGMRVQKTGETEGVVMTFREKVDPALQPDITAIREALGLAQDAKEFRVAYGAVAKDDKEIAILSRSMLEILIDIASYIQVPQEHVEQQRVNATMEPETVNDKPVPPLMRILSASTKPTDTFIAIPYRDHWYWIEDRDLKSKNLFTFLMFVFSLTETEGREGAPIVTIPAG
jgi:hypothetical protein